MKGNFMKKVIHTYSERVTNPNLQLIDFSLLASNRLLYQVKVIEEYWLDSNFRNEVNIKLKRDIIFKNQFIKYFPDLYQEILNSNEIKKNHLSK